MTVMLDYTSVSVGVFMKEISRFLRIFKKMARIRIRNSKSDFCDNSYLKPIIIRKGNSSYEEKEMVWDTDVIVNRLREPVSMWSFIDLCR